MNKHIELALRTWYPKDHELHFEPMPCLLGLVGEAGEIADLVKKAIYKHGKERPDRDKMLGELGDYWYYLRIAFHQCGFEGIDSFIKSANYSIMRTSASNRVLMLAQNTSIFIGEWDDCTFVDCLTDLLALLKKFDCTLDQLTELNWQKLQGGKHGWKDNSQIVIIEGSEIDFRLEVPLGELEEKVRDIWDNPQKYYDCSDGGYYSFLKFLWVTYPDGSDKRLGEIVYN